MAALHALIFDLDGTLVDSAGDLLQSLNILLTKRGRRLLALDEVKSMIGDGMPMLLRRAFKATGDGLADQDADAVFSEMLSIYMSKETSPEIIYQDAKETLMVFKKANVKIGLCTNKAYAPTLKLLKDIGLLSLFDVITGGDTFTVCKPHPDHVLGVVAKLGVDRQSCVMIGDSINDIQAARSAGVASIAVSHGYGTNVKSLNADALIARFAELPGALLTLGFSYPDLSTP
jgi:phosphoglycolate phosphatase